MLASGPKAGAFTSRSSPRAASQASVESDDPADALDPGTVSVPAEALLLAWYRVCLNRRGLPLFSRPPAVANVAELASCDWRATYCSTLLRRLENMPEPPPAGRGPVDAAFAAAAAVLEGTWSSSAAAALASSATGPATPICLPDRREPCKLFCSSDTMGALGRAAPSDCLPKDLSLTTDAGGGGRDPPTLSCGFNDLYAFTDAAYALSSLSVLSISSSICCSSRCIASHASLSDAGRSIRY